MTVRKFYTTLPTGVYYLDFPDLNTSSVYHGDITLVVPTSPFFYQEPYPGAWPLSHLGGEGYLRRFTIRVRTPGGVTVEDPDMQLELGLQHSSLSRR